MKIITILLLLALTSFTGIKNTSGIHLKKIEKLLCNNWSYQYSINNGIKEIITNEVFTYGSTNVYFKIEFLKYTLVEQFYFEEHADYKTILSDNILEGIEMFGDYKGCPEYPILLNDATNDKGNLVECKIQTFWNCGEEVPVKSKAFYIDKLTKDSLIISGYMVGSRENKIVYSKIKQE